MNERLESAPRASRSFSFLSAPPPHWVQASRGRRRRMACNQQMPPRPDMRRFSSSLLLVTSPLLLFSSHFSSHFFFLALLPPPAAAGRLPPLAVPELLAFLAKGSNLLSAATGLGPLLTKKDSSRVCLPAVEHLFSRSMTLSTRAYGAGVGSEGRGVKGRGVKGVEKSGARWRLVERVSLHKEGAEPRHVGSAPAQLDARRVHHLLRARARGLGSGSGSGSGLGLGLGLGSGSGLGLGLGVGSGLGLGVRHLGLQEERARRAHLPAPGGG